MQIFCIRHKEQAQSLNADALLCFSNAQQQCRVNVKAQEL